MKKPATTKSEKVIKKKFSSKSIFFSNFFFVKGNCINAPVKIVY